MNHRKSAKSTDRAITLVHPGKGNGRRFALISKVLSSMGLKHSAVVPFFGVGSLGRLEQAALADPYCQKVRKIPSGTQILIGTPGQINNVASEKKLAISFDTESFLSGEKAANSFFHPILFHPDLVSEAHYWEAAEFAENHDREIGILFAGNCDPKTYSSSRMKSEYGVISRIEIEALAKRLPQERVFIPRNADEFRAALNEGALKKRLVWIDTNKFRIPQSEWLAFIAHSRFFVCTPGVQYPYCQNLNEAAACGSVPILQFPDAYSPPLIDGENALKFNGEADFDAAMLKALEMPKGGWETMSSSAVKYHEDHLSLSALQSRLQDFLDNPEQDRMTWVMAGKQK